MSTPPPSPIERRVTELEVHIADVGRRLQLGADTLQEIRQSIKPVPMRVWLFPTLGLLVTLGGAALTLAWHAGRVPDREEISALRQGLHDLEVRQARLDQTLTDLERSTRRIEEGQRALTEMVAGIGRRKR